MHRRDAHNESPSSDHDVSPRALREVMGRFPTGVTVLTLRQGQTLYGITVNSFTSVSLDPPLVLVCIANKGRFVTLAAKTGVFCVNILADRGRGVSDRFAGRRDLGAEAFEDCMDRTTPGGAPVMADAVAWMECELSDTYPAGDHLIFVARVRALESRETEGRSLVFYRGRYHVVGPGLDRDPAFTLPDPDVEFTYAQASL